MYWLAIRYLLAVSIGLLAGWTVQGWRKSAEIQSLKTQAAEKEAQAVSKALDLTRQASQKTQRIIDRQRDAKVGQGFFQRPQQLLGAELGKDQGGLLLDQFPQPILMLG